MTDPTPTTSNTTGVSNPPADDTQVTSLTPPADAMQQNDSASAPQAQPAAGTPPVQGPGQQTSPQAQQSNQPQINPRQSPGLQPNSPNQVVQTGPQQQAPPGLKRAGWISQIAETLSGGPRYQISVDSNTGVTTRTKVPVSGKQLGLAIAMEALTGALTGLGQHGPDAAGKAAAAGVQQGLQLQKQAQQRQEQQNSEDYARQMQTVETNMRMYSNAQTIGRQNLQSNQEYVAQWAPLVKTLQEQFPQAFKGVVSYQDLPKYHITADQAIPYQTIPRPDPDHPGQQAKDQFGTPLYDINYLIVDPNFKAANLISKDDQETCAKYNMQGCAAASPNLPIAMRLGMVIDLKTKLSALRMQESSMSEYYRTLNEGSEEGGQPAPLKLPTIRSSAVQALLDDSATRWAKTSGVSPETLQSVVRGIANQESGGNPNVPDSDQGAIGVMQLLPSTAAQYKVDPHNTAQNVDGGVHYIADLLQRYQGDPKLAIAAYFDGPNNVTDHVPATPKTQQYVASVAKMIGLGETQPGGSQKFKPVNLVQAIKDDASLPKALEQFNGMFSQTGNVAQALQGLDRVDPTGVLSSKIAALYGGRPAIDQYDATRKQQLEQADLRLKAGEQNSKEAADRAAKAAETEQTYSDNAKQMAGTPGQPWTYAPIRLTDLVSQRTADRPKVMAMIHAYNPGWSEGAVNNMIDIWKDFSEGKSSDQIKSANTLFDHIGDAIEVSDSYRRSGQSDLLNRPWNWFKTHTGDPQVVQFQASFKPVQDEFLTFLQNNHALTQSDKETGQQLIDKAETPAQFEGAMKQIAHTAALRLYETNDRFQRIIGRKTPGLLSADAVQAISKLTDANGRNPVAEVLGDMDTGGDLSSSGTLGGTLGKTVNTALGRPPVPGAVAGRKNGQIVAWRLPNGQQVDVNGNPLPQSQSQAQPSQPGQGQ